MRKLQKNRIWHIIPHMRRLFLKVEDNPDLVVNSEAANLHREQLPAFKIKVKECVEHRWVGNSTSMWLTCYLSISQAIVYEAPKTDDINEIHFVELSDDEFVLNRNKMLRTKAKASFHSKSGCSWMTADAPSRPFAESRDWLNNKRSILTLSKPSMVPSSRKTTNSKQSHITVHCQFNLILTN